MFRNAYAGKCKSCGCALNPGDGFAFKNYSSWSQVCNSTACISKLGLTMPDTKKTLSESGEISMPYDANAIPLLKSLPGARWNPEKKIWTCSTKIGDLARVIEIADKIGLDVPEVFRQNAEAGTSISVEAVARAKAISQIYSYQVEGVKFLALHNRALLGDDMGLGKTIQALTAIPNERAIIVCPAALKFNWLNEFKRWRPNDFDIYVCDLNSFFLPKDREIVIINFESLPKWLLPNKDYSNNLTAEQKEILSQTTLIVDECHRVKNYKAQMSQKVKTLSSSSKNVWFLTGTPLMNRAADLYGILQAGDMRALGSWDKFVSLFNGYRTRFGYEFGDPKPEVAEMMKRVMLRRLKSNVLKDLPPKIHSSYQVSIRDTDSSDLNTFLLEIALSQGLVESAEELKNSMSETAGLINMRDLPSFNHFSKIRSLLASSRIPAMLELVEDYEESATPLVVFSAHKAPIQALANRDGWRVIDGDVSPKERTDIVELFQAGKLKGVGLTIKAGGVGLTLTHASNVLFVDLDWTPALNVQAEDRLSRIGQKNSVNVIRMVSNHPLDIHIQHLLEYKTNIAQAALDSEIKYESKPSNEVSLKEETEEERSRREVENAAKLNVVIEKISKKADADYAKSKVAAILVRESAKAKMPEVELTNERKDLLLSALSAMVGVCDGAMTKDYQGFNKPDSAIAHWIYATGLDRDDETTFRVLERILSRYYKQLNAMGLGDIW